VTTDVAAVTGPGQTPGGERGGAALDDVRVVHEPLPALEPPQVLGSLRVPPVRVTAVLVARDGADFLPRALSALSSQTRPPDAVVGVDAGSRDASGDLLAAALPVTVRLARRCTFSRAVTAALRDDAAAPPEGLDPAHDWVWLLHDDAAPEAEALARLLAAVETAPSVAVAGCKHVDWDDDQRILDVGLTTTRGGTRVRVADRDEVDQGQHDARSDVLAVGTAGMLVRRDVWTRLGGGDPGLAHAREDLDLGRRAHLAGHRVVVVPGAVVAHAAAWSTGRRPGAPSWQRAERRDALHLRLAAAPLPAVPLLLLAATLAALPRAGGHLALRHPLRAADELLAVLAVWARPDRLVRSRWRARRVRTVPRRTVRPLYASRLQAVRERWDLAAGWILPAPASGRQAPVATSVRTEDPDTGALAGLLGLAGAAATRPDAPRLPPARPHRVDGGPVRVRPGPGFALSGLFPVLAVTAAVAVLGWAEVIGGRGVGRLLSGDAALVGPELLPAPATARALWRAAGSGWRPSGLGAAAAADPLAAVLAVLSLPLGGAPERLVEVLVLAAPPLAALAAWTAAGAITRSRLVRGWAALVWAAAPPLLGAVAAGRVGAVLAHVGLPLLALALARAFGLTGGRRGLRGRRPSLHAAFAAGLLLAGELAAAPSLAVAGAVGVGALAAVAATRVRQRPGGAVPASGGDVARDDRRGDSREGVPGDDRGARTVIPGVRARRPGPVARVLGAAFVVVAVPGLLLLPWWAAVLRAPRLLAADPDLSGASAAGLPGGTPSAWWHLLLLTAPPADGAPSGTPTGAADLAARALATAGVATPGATGLAVALAAVLAVPAVVAGLAALLRRRGGDLAVAAWAAALAGLLTAVTVTHVVAGATGPGLDGGTPFAGPPGPGLSLLALGALACAVGLLRRGTRTLRRAAVPRPRTSPEAARPRSAALRVPVVARRAATTVALAVALTGPVVTLAGWSWQGVAGPGGGVAARHLPALHAVDPDVLPPAAAAEAEGPAAARTLVVRVDRTAPGTVRWTLARSAGPRLGDDSAALAARRVGSARPETDRVAPVLGALLAGGSRDVRERLADLGVGSVLVTAPVPAEVTLALDASPGLVRMSQSATGVLWRVDLPAGRGGATRPVGAWLVDGGTRVAVAMTAGEVDARIPPGAQGRLVRLAERADRGWQATLDGVALAPAAGADRAQAFWLPAAGGRLQVRHVAPSAGAIGIVQAGTLAVAVLGLLPLPRVRRRLAPPPPPARSRPVRRAANPVRELPPMPRVFGDEHPEDGDVEPLFSDETAADPAPADEDPPADEAGTSPVETAHDGPEDGATPEPEPEPELEHEPEPGPEPGPEPRPEDGESVVEGDGTAPDRGGDAG